MKKDTYYFPHDYEPTSDPKIQALIGEYGSSGYGIYWRVVEMLHSDLSHKLPLKQYVFLAIAKQMLANAEQIQAILNYCIDPCELMQTDGKMIWSERVLRNIKEREELSEKRAVAGRAGAIAKQRSAKRGKGKEKKGNNNIVVLDSVIKKNGINLSEEFYNLILEWLKYKSEKGQSYKETGLKNLITTFLRDSNSDPAVGREMLVYSMSNNYSGLFKEKGNKTNPKQVSVTAEFKRPIPEDLKKILSDDRQNVATSVGR